MKKKDILIELIIDALIVVSAAVLTSMMMQCVNSL